MAAWRQAMELAFGEAELAALGVIGRSRTEPARRVERARMLLAYHDYPSFFAAGQAVGVHHQTVRRCVERALAYMARLRRLTICRAPDGSRQSPPRPGRGW